MGRISFNNCYLDLSRFQFLKICVSVFCPIFAVKLIGDHCIKHLKSQNSTNQVQIVLKMDIYQWGGKFDPKKFDPKKHPPKVAFFGENLAVFGFWDLATLSLQRYDDKTKTDQNDMISKLTSKSPKNDLKILT